METVCEAVEREDFNFYGNEDEEHTEEVKGITDNVTSFTHTGLSYPCLIFKEGFTCPKHKLKVISNMVKTVNDAKDVCLYFLNNNEVFKMGELSGLQINSFLEIVGEEGVFGYYDEKTKLQVTTEMKNY